MPNLPIFFMGNDIKAATSTSLVSSTYCTDSSEVAFRSVIWCKQLSMNHVNCFDLLHAIFLWLPFDFEHAASFTQLTGLQGKSFFPFEGINDFSWRIHIQINSFSFWRKGNAFFSMNSVFTPETCTKQPEEAPLEMHGGF